MHKCTGKHGNTLKTQKLIVIVLSKKLVKLFSIIVYSKHYNIEKERYFFCLKERYCLSNKFFF